MGCTSLEIYSSDNILLRTDKYLGLTILTVDPKAAGAIIYKSSSLGLMTTPTNTTFGWSKETSAIFTDPNRCQTIIWTESIEDVLKINDLLQKRGLDLARICPISSGVTK